MKLLATACRMTVFILGLAWILFTPEWVTAQTKQDGFVIRNPVVVAARQSLDGESSKRQSQQLRAARNSLPASWSSVQEKEVSPEQQLDRDVDSVDLQDKFQDQLQKDVLEGAKLDEEKLAESRRTQFDFGQWPRRTITEIRTTVKDESAMVPPDNSYLLMEKAGPDWFMAPSGDKVFAWVAPNIHYQPLYFQNVALERYGQTCGGLKQSAASGFHFFTSFCRLPIAVIVDRPHSCEYPLGYCRPGNPTPMTFQKLLHPVHD